MAIASQPKNDASGQDPPVLDSAPLRALLSEARRVVGYGPGLTEIETAEILSLIRLIEIELIALQIRGSVLHAPSERPNGIDDSWLTPDEVATRLKRTRAWVYRQARRWPFAKRPSRKTLLISESGLARWMESR